MHLTQLLILANDRLHKYSYTPSIEPVRDDQADAFYADLDARISAVIFAGWTPVILVASGRRADYLSPYRLPEDGYVPPGFSIRPPERKERGLYATVNGVEVYAVPMSSSRYVVFPKEYLQILRYQEQPRAIGVMVHSKNESRGKCEISVDFVCEFVAMPPGAEDLHA